MNKETTTDNYEQALQELKTILQQMEQGDRNMDKLVAQVQQANTLVEQCKDRLRGIEDDVRSIL